MKSNRSAIGARIRVRTKAPEGPRDIFRVVTAGGSFGDSPLRVHVGLEHASAITEVEVRWPASQMVQVFRNLAMDRSFRVREGEARPVEFKRKTFAFSAASVHRHQN